LKEEYPLPFSKEAKIPPVGGVASLADKYEEKALGRTATTATRTSLYYCTA
jgi:hypothetical protein